jgi:MoaA/NifB/PqqE/SkfB family radical SAM enzyme|tara:strand:- start:203 stop:1117 length:915 start_codon:yes stop_codon:yes gene_type:complete
MFKVESRWGHHTSIHVEWNIGKRCNLDCGYCPAEIHDNFSPHTDLDKMVNTIYELEKIGKPIRLSLTGGEPTVHPKINNILECARARLQWLSVTTNGLRSADWYIKQPVNQWVFSLHFDNEHSQRAAENIVRYSQLLDMEGKDTLFQVNLMAHHKHMDAVRAAAILLEGHNIPYVCRRIRWTKAEERDYFDDMRYAEKDLEWILSKTATVKANCVVDDEHKIHANDVIKHKLNQFEGWTCNAGLESLMINWDGEVHRATCRVGDSLGNIYNGTFESPVAPVICTRKWCTCVADIPLTKVLDVKD